MTEQNTDAGMAKIKRSDLSPLKHQEQKLDGRALNAGLRDGDSVNLLRSVSGQNTPTLTMNI